MKIDRQLVMGGTSLMIKSSRKTQGRLRLSYKNQDFFGTFRALQDFSKMTEFMGVDRRDFYQF